MLLGLLAGIVRVVGGVACRLAYDEYKKDPEPANKMAREIKDHIQDVARSEGVAKAAVTTAGIGAAMGAGVLVGITRAIQKELLSPQQENPKPPAKNPKPPAKNPKPPAKKPDSEDCPSDKLSLSLTVQLESTAAGTTPRRNTSNNYQHMKGCFPAPSTLRIQCSRLSTKTAGPQHKVVLMLPSAPAQSTPLFSVRVPSQPAEASRECSV